MSYRPPNPITDITTVSDAADSERFKKPVRYDANDLSGKAQPVRRATPQKPAANNAVPVTMNVGRDVHGQLVDAAQQGEQPVTLELATRQPLAAPTTAVTARPATGVQRSR